MGGKKRSPLLNEPFSSPCLTIGSRAPLPPTPPCPHLLFFVAFHLSPAPSSYGRDTWRGSRPPKDAEYARYFSAGEAAGQADRKLAKFYARNERDRTCIRAWKPVVTENTLDSLWGVHEEYGVDAISRKKHVPVGTTPAFRS